MSTVANFDHVLKPYTADRPRCGASIPLPCIAAAALVVASYTCSWNLADGTCEKEEIEAQVQAQRLRWWLFSILPRGRLDSMVS